MTKEFIEQQIKEYKEKAKYCMLDMSGWDKNSEMYLNLKDIHTNYLSMVSYLNNYTPPKPTQND